MSTGECLYLILVLFGFTFFAVNLALVESRQRRRAQGMPRAPASAPGPRRSSGASPGPAGG
jgi:hypothetical protein